MVLSWRLLILIGSLVLPVHLIGQHTLPEIPRDPVYLQQGFLEKGIQCAIEPVDDATMALIPDVRSILDAVIGGVEAAGWDVRSSSPFSIMVSLQSRGKAKDGTDLIRISVSVSEREEEGEDFGRSAHPLVVTNTRRLAEERDPGLVAAVEQMAGDIARRLKMDLIKRSSMHRSRDLDVPADDGRLD